MSDKNFANPKINDDFGDALIELTSKGDCEDFGHFYMRTIRMLTNIYKYMLPDSNTDLYKKCQVLENEYVAFNYICKVEINNQEQYHSTMLIVPREQKEDCPVISFEVTHPDKSYSLPNEEFNTWHKKHYFILDSIYIHRLNRIREPISGKISDLCYNKLLFFNY